MEVDYSRFQEIFPDEKMALNFIYDIVIGPKYICPHCSSEKVYRRKDMPKNFLCKECNNHYSGLRGTIFEYTSTELSKWLFGIYAFQNGYVKTAMKFMRSTGVTYKTAWRVIATIKRPREPHEEEMINKIMLGLNKLLKK